jgi:signal transduction histidine kinase
MLFEFSSPCYWQPRNLKNFTVPILQNIGPSIGAVFILLFTYHFPFHIKSQRQERRILLLLYILIDLTTLGLAIYNFFYLELRHSIYSFEPIYYQVLYVSIAIQFFLCIVLLLRKSVLLSKRKHRSALSKLFRPLGKDARAAHSLALAWLIPSSVVLIFMASSYHKGLHPVTAAHLAWFGFLLFYCVFVVTYLNHTSERTTVQVKLIGVSLVAIISILSVLAIIVGKIHEMDYRDDSFISDNQTLLFTPNRFGSYSIERKSLVYEKELGKKLTIQSDSAQRFDLRFPFSYFGKPIESIWVLDGPLVILGKEVQENGWGGFNPQPAIAPLISYLDLSSGGAIYASSEENSLVITWHEIPEIVNKEPNTLQLTLKSNNTFFMSYVRLSSAGLYRSVQLDVYYTARLKGKHPGTKNLAYEPKLIGIHPGGNNVPLETISLSRDLPYSSRQCAAIYDAFDLKYFKYIHERASPLVIMLLVSCVCVLFFFPILLRKNLIRPLQSLYEGMRRADEGEPDAEVRPQFNDEIGFLARTFNKMVVSIREAEAKARHQQQQIQQMDKLTSLGILVAAVAHEINNPNQTILSSSSFLRRACTDIKVILDDCQSEYEGMLVGGMDYSEFRNGLPESIGIIEECSKQIDQIVRGLRDFVRLEPSRMEGSVSLNTVINDAITLVSHFIEKSTDNFTIQLEPNLPDIRGHSQRLIQVLINLLQNACQSLPDRSKGISIVSSHDKEKGCVVVKVQDEGSGISEDDLARIRSPFFTTKRKTGGTGLGLYVSETIVQEHRGSLSFQSKRGEGTVAMISIPVEKA